MFYKTEIKDHIRVPPNLFNLPREEAILKCIKRQYEGYMSKEMGIAVDVSAVKEVKEGIIIPGDGASYYETVFNLLVFKPELQEVINGKIKDITDFGVFMNIGPIEGMVHISQTMDDFVSFSKEKVLTGKDSKRVLKIGDKCIARIVAVSFKDITNPKLGLTMRQMGLGKLDWIEEDKEEEAPVEKEEKKEKKEKKSKEKKKK
ncbi:DNA-directed RNA polymerase [Candidatus Woesearchaeota archaeon]|nr:DNA-directed RNA polymerase [Candidatus Woesearchaeota archaeon]